MTQPSPAETIRAAAQLLRRHVSIGASTATPAGAALLRAREPIAQWLDTAADYAERWPSDQQLNSPFRADAYQVALAVLGENR